MGHIYNMQIIKLQIMFNQRILQILEIIATDAIGSLEDEHEKYSMKHTVL